MWNALAGAKPWPEHEVAEGAWGAVGCSHKDAGTQTISKGKSQ